MRRAETDRDESHHELHAVSRWKTYADVVTLMVAGTALLLAGWTIWGSFGLTASSGVVPTENRKIAQWPEVVSGGRRIGPAEAQVVIVVFGDYECPFCRRMEGPLSLVLKEYPEEVAVVYRHFPLSIHDGAHRAAKMAECAGEQQRFEAMHRFLFRNGDLMEIGVSVAADSAGVPDLPEFVKCMGRTAPVPGIEADMEVAAQLGIRAVPAVIFDGTLLARPPDSLDMVNLVRAALLGNESPDPASGTPKEGTHR